MMTNDKATALREAAERATLGPWDSDPEDDAYLALATPPTILDLLAERERLRGALDRADGLINAMSDYVGKMALSADHLAALNEHWLFMERIALQALEATDDQ